MALKPLAIVGASDIAASPYLRLLNLGGPKVGKTYTVLSTCPKPAFVINSDDEYSLKPAARATKEFSAALVLGNDPEEISAAIHHAKTEAAAGHIKTVVWDTMSQYARRIEKYYEKRSANGAGEPDGRRYWKWYKDHLHTIIDRLFTIKAHVIVNSHWLDLAGIEIAGQTKKTGSGICPSLGGTARQTIPAEFQDVVFLDKSGDERFFVTSSTGVWGPGCRNLQGRTSVPADVSKLWDLMQGKKDVALVKDVKVKK